MHPTNQNILQRRHDSLKKQARDYAKQLLTNRNNLAEWQTSIADAFDLIKQGQWEIATLNKKYEVLSKQAESLCKERDDLSNQLANKVNSNEKKQVTQAI